MSCGHDGCTCGHDEPTGDKGVTIADTEKALPVAGKDNTGCCSGHDGGGHAGGCHQLDPAPAANEG